MTTEDVFDRTPAESTAYIIRTRMLYQQRYEQVVRALGLDKGTDHQDVLKVAYALRDMLDDEPMGDGE